MKFRFRPEDFLGYKLNVLIASRAQNVLDAHLAKCPKVYGNLEINDRRWLAPLTESNAPAGSSHQAVLFDVEEIEELKACYHADYVSIDSDGDIWCTKCGNKLKPTGWQTVEG